MSYYSAGARAHCSIVDLLLLKIHFPVDASEIDIFRATEECDAEAEADSSEAEADFYVERSEEGETEAEAIRGTVTCVRSRY